MHDSLVQRQQLRFQLAAACTALSGLLFSILPAEAVTFSTPKGVPGTPTSQTSGGASRQGGQCLSPSTTTSAMAIVPPKTQALTVSDHPTFFVYVPPTTAKEASFSLQDAQGEQYYQTKVTLPSNGGTISIPLPATVSTLEVGQTYQWFFEIHCSPQFDPDNPMVEGAVSRTTVDAALTRQLAASQTDLDKAQVYGDAGIWYDTIGTLAQARQDRPYDPTLERNWQELLKSIGLDEIADRPIVGYNVATRR